jgi:hypothetical protein
VIRILPLLLLTTTPARAAPFALGAFLVAPHSSRSLAHAGLRCT